MLGCCNYSNHRQQNCKIAKVCGVNGCSSKHHRLLHQNITDRRSDSDQTGEQKENVNCLVQTTKTIFYQIVPITIVGNNCERKTFAFFDTGSSVSLISGQIANEIDARLDKWGSSRRDG